MNDDDDDGKDGVGGDDDEVDRDYGNGMEFMLNVMMAFRSAYIWHVYKGLHVYKMPLFELVKGTSVKDIVLIDG